MMAQKQTEASAARTQTTTAPPAKTSRKAWKKKTPVEIMLDQIEKIREDVADKEEELKQAKRQLQKLEEARKVLEAT